MMRKTMSALLVGSCMLVGSAAAQSDAWQHKWYWGAQGGVMAFQTPTGTGWQSAYTVGGHWLITGGRSALYFAFDQVFFKDSTSSAVLDASSSTGIRTVQFNTGRRIQAHLYVIPMDTFLQIYLGGGFGINQVVDAAPEGVFSTPQQFENVLRIIDETSTKAFPTFSGGAQLRLSRLALFGHYQFMPTGRNYLITSAQHVFAIGFRWALTGAREEVTTQGR